MTSPEKGKKTLLYNLIFLGICGGLFVFLWMAPEESTKKLPLDDDHAGFHQLKKKEAEKFCEECHFPEGVKPLPEGHPPKYRCLFCHKQQR